MAKRIKLETRGETKDGDNVLDFLKSRPQIAALESSTTKAQRTAKTRSGHAADGAEAADLLLSDRFVSVLNAMFCMSPSKATMETLTDNSRLSQVVC